MSASKKFVAVRGDLLQKIIEISNRKGKTVYGFVNEIFEQAIKAEELDSTLPEIVDFYVLVKTLRKAGATLIFSDILNYSIKRLYEVEKEKLLKSWFSSGLWYGKFLKAKFQKPIEVLKKVLTSLFFFEISEVEFSNIEENKFSLKVISPNQPQENTELLSSFLEGILNALDFNILNRDCWRGIIIFEVEKRIKLSEMGLRDMEE